MTTDPAFDALTAVDYIRAEAALAGRLTRPGTTGARIDGNIRCPDCLHRADEHEANADGGGCSSTDECGCMTGHDAPVEDVAPPCAGCGHQHTLADGGCGVWSDDDGMCWCEKYSAPVAPAEAAEHCDKCGHAGSGHDERGCTIEVAGRPCWCERYAAPTETAPAPVAVPPPLSAEASARTLRGLIGHDEALTAEYAAPRPDAVAFVGQDIQAAREASQARITDEILGELETEEREAADALAEISALAATALRDLRRGEINPDVVMLGAVAELREWLGRLDEAIGTTPAATKPPARVPYRDVAAADRIYLDAIGGSYRAGAGDESGETRRAGLRAVLEAHEVVPVDAVPTPAATVKSAAEIDRLRAELAAETRRAESWRTAAGSAMRRVDELEAAQAHAAEVPAGSESPLVDIDPDSPAGRVAAQLAAQLGDHLSTISLGIHSGTLHACPAGRQLDKLRSIVALLPDETLTAQGGNGWLDLRVPIVRDGVRACISLTLTPNEQDEQAAARTWLAEIGVEVQ